MEAERGLPPQAQGECSHGSAPLQAPRTKLLISKQREARAVLEGCHKQGGHGLFDTELILKVEATMTHFAFNVMSGEEGTGVPHTKQPRARSKLPRQKTLVPRKKAVERPHVGCLPGWMKHIEIQITGGLFVMVA